MPRLKRDRARGFVFYPEDYLSDPAVRAMGVVGRGAYGGALLPALWNLPEPGVVEADDELLASLALCTPEEWASVRDRVARAFDLKSRPGYWIQKRMVAQAAARQRRFNEMQKSNRAAGIRSARLREARHKGRHARWEWLDLLAEFRGRCARCWQVPESELVKDHIVPIYQGGSDSIENIQPLCRRCNSQKGPENTDWKTIRRQELGNSVLTERSTLVQPNEERGTRNIEEPPTPEAFPSRSCNRPAAPSRATRARARGAQANGADPAEPDRHAEATVEPEFDPEPPPEPPPEEEPEPEFVPSNRYDPEEI